MRRTLSGIVRPTCASDDRPSRRPHCLLTSAAFHSHPSLSYFHPRSQRDDVMDKRFGFPKYTEGPDRLGWCINMQPVSLHQAPDFIHTRFGPPPQRQPRKLFTLLDRVQGPRDGRGAQRRRLLLLGGGWRPVSASHGQCSRDAARNKHYPLPSHTALRNLCPTRLPIASRPPFHTSRTSSSKSRTAVKLSLTSTSAENMAAALQASSKCGRYVFPQNRLGNDNVCYAFRSPSTLYLPFRRRRTWTSTITWLASSSATSSLSFTMSK